MENVQTCETCGATNRATQTSWKACCLLSFDFDYGQIGIDAHLYGDLETSKIYEVGFYLRRATVSDNGVRFLTFKCVTPQEVDYEVEGLIRNLRRAAKQAKLMLKKA